MRLLPAWQTVPFLAIWVSLTAIYGFRLWRLQPTILTLAAVTLATGGVIGVQVLSGQEDGEYLAEVSLIALMFLVMVWHGRRRLAAMAERLAAMEQMQRVTAENLQLLERQRRFLQDASHELGTPITVALGHAELIERAVTDPGVVEDARVVEDELLRLRRLATRMLLLASVGSADFLHLAPVEVEPLVVEALGRWDHAPRRWSQGAVDEMTVLGDRDRRAVALEALLEHPVAHRGGRSHRGGRPPGGWGCRARRGGHGLRHPDRGPRADLRPVRPGRRASQPEGWRVRPWPGGREGDHGGPIPVGTALAGGPPDRSQRAELPHWAPALGPGGEAHAGIGVHDAGRGQQPIGDPAKPLPGEPAALASAPKRFPPGPPHLVTKGRHRVDVAWHSVVGEMSSHHARQPAPLVGDGEVPASPKLGFHLLQLRPQPLFDGDAPEPEAPVPGLPTDVGEAQEVERLRLGKAPLLPVRRREAAELDKPGLIRVQLQVELREPLAKVSQEPLRITEVLEPDHEVIGEHGDDHVAPGVPQPPLPGPAVKDVVKVHVGEQRRADSSHAIGNFEFEALLPYVRGERLRRC